MDISSLEPGARWPVRLEASLKTCGTVLAVIGPNWLTARDKKRHLRIDQKGDWVTQELKLAFAAQRKVIPVLVRGEKAPSMNRLQAMSESVPLLGNDTKPD